MSIWPLHSTFTIKLGNGVEEKWTVANHSDFENQITSSDSPIGLALLNSVPGLIPYKNSKGKKLEFELIEIKPPDESRMAENVAKKLTTLFKSGSKEASSQVVKPIEPNMTDVLSHIDTNKELSGEILDWLEKRRMLGFYHEKHFRLRNVVFHAIKASSYWRKANDPARALKATIGINETNTNAKSMAIIWTTRGGALKDMKEYDKALRCADKSIELTPESHHSFNLRGAVLMSLEKYDEAFDDFLYAQALGERNTQLQISNAITMIDNPQINRVKEILSNSQVLDAQAIREIKAIFGKG